MSIVVAGQRRAQLHVLTLGRQYSFYQKAQTSLFKERKSLENLGFSVKRRDRGSTRGAEAGALDFSFLIKS